MITLFKGDDTHGQLGKKCFIKFHCDDAVDMTNVRVRFNLINIVTKDFENVHDGSELEIFISHQDARKLPLGVTHGKLWGEDSSGKIRTFANRIPFVVTTDLRKVYGSDGLDSVDIHVYASVDWDSVANKPTLFPSKVSMVEGLEEALKQAGKVKTVNGQSPDENGNIEIELPSCKVTSVNGKDGDVKLTSKDIPYGGEGASNVEIAIEQNTQAAVDNANAIDSLEQQVGELKSGTYTKGEVDEKINQSAAHYLTKRAGTEGHYTYPQFATHADLVAAKAAHTETNPQFWYGDDPHTPDKNDYCVVLDDETHGHATTRYMFVGVWPDGLFRYQYTVNETALTQAQWDALNSGITEEILGQLARKSDIPYEVTEETVSGWGFFRGTIETIKNALSTVFAALKHDHESTEIKVKYGESEFPLIADPSALNPVTGQAADAYETRKGLERKVDKDNLDISYYSNGRSRLIRTISGEYYNVFESSDYKIEFVSNPMTSKIIVTDKSNNVSDDNATENSDRSIVAVLNGSQYVFEYISDRVLSLKDLTDKLTDSDLDTLCTACGISLAKPDGTKKTRAEKLLGLFGQSNSQLVETIRAKVLADGDGEIKAALFADTAFKTGVATALDEQVAKDKITALAEAAVENKITTEDASLVALIKKYGGTQIKEDEKGFYYEVEEEA